MKKIISGIGLIIVILCAPMLAIAENNEIGGAVLYSTIEEEGTDNAIGFGLSYTRVIMPNVGVEISLDRMSFGVEDSDIDLISMPLRVTGQYRISTDSPFRPWVGAGIGYYLNEVDGGDAGETIDCSDFGGDCIVEVSFDADDAFGFHIGGGTDYIINDKLAFFIGLKYRIVEADTKTDVSCSGDPDLCDAIVGGSDEFDTSLPSLDMNGIEINTGIKYLF